MPDIIILASPEARKKIGPHFYEIARTLREVTANTLPDLEDNPGKVSVCLLPWVLGQNMADIQILGLASHNSAREQVIDQWRNILLRAMATFLEDDDPAAKDLKGLQIEVWPIMPIGRWGQL